MARAGEVADAARPPVDSHLDDPGMVAFFPDPSVRPRALPQVCGLTVADALAFNTQNEANHAYYRRFGFEVAHDAWRTGGGPTSWTMHRPAG